MPSAQTWVTIGSGDPPPIPLAPVRELDPLFSGACVGGTKTTVTSKRMQTVSDCEVAANADNNPASYFSYNRVTGECALYTGVCTSGDSQSNYDTYDNIENPSEDKRTYSSRYSATTTESMLDSGVFAQSWRSSTATVNQWMQIDLGTVKSVFGVVTQGQIKYNYWVKSFTVSTSTSGNTWLPVNNAEIFYGNTDKSSRVRNDFTLVAARYVRIYAQTWNSKIGMRAGVVVTTGTPPSIPSRSYSILALATD